MLAERPRSPNALKRLDSLSRSFIKTLLLYQCIQFAILAAYAVPKGFFAAYVIPFAAVSIAFHGLIFTMLCLFKGDFVIVPSGRALERVNTANAITLFRVSTLPTILFVILASKNYPIRYSLVALVAIVFATDFLDGYVSRKNKETTRVGKMMDSASDYSLLFVITIVYYYFRVIPAWLFGLLVLRLAGQVAMVIVVLAVKKRITPKTTFLGKATVASTMILYAFELLRFVADIPLAAYSILEYVVGAIIVASIVDKVLIMARDLRAPAQPSSGQGRLNPITHGENNGSD
ncbi:MAG: hypothetical protein CVV47_02320 [Spirochaetae bacterium HGW-Spirochaetae-3]|jgi:phosphatidylglycerophosphate synthase|nr:MAG: hypothetical protein CVV47_02320 [Spirochaetae bacterium HGW-Spirochaetae-3]